VAVAVGASVTVAVGVMVSPPVGVVGTAVVPGICVSTVVPGVDVPVTARVVPVAVGVAFVVGVVVHPAPKQRRTPSTMTAERARFNFMEVR